MKWSRPTFSRLLINYWSIASDGYLVYKYILSISGWWSIEFNDAFVFPDPEPLVINILYGWSGIHGHFGLCCFLFSLVKSSKLIVVCLYLYTVAAFPVFVYYGYDVILLKVFNLLSSLLFSAILLISSVYTLCPLLFSLCCYFHMISLFS